MAIELQITTVANSSWGNYQEIVSVAGIDIPNNKGKLRANNCMVAFFVSAEEKAKGTPPVKVLNYSLGNTLYTTGDYTALYNYLITLSKERGIWNSNTDEWKPSLVGGVIIPNAPDPQEG